MSFLIRPLFKTWAQRLLGDRYYMPLSDAYHRYSESAAFWADARWDKSIKRLLKYKNRHKGERCFIIGNGPSLKKMDLSLLKNDVTFGMNRIYLMFNDLGFSTTYYVTVNKLVVEQCARDIVKLSCPKFISWHARNLIDFTSNMICLYSDCDGTHSKFFTDITKGVNEGATVTYVAMQIAYYMGFEKVILVGVDHSFKTQGKPHTMVVSEGDDLNHFDPGYFGKGFRWQLPDLRTSELVYRIAKYQFENTNREILDATIDGKLQVFPKVDYHQLF